MFESHSRSSSYGSDVGTSLRFVFQYGIDLQDKHRRYCVHSDLLNEHCLPSVETGRRSKIVHNSELLFFSPKILVSVC